jgi:hypothetical protein
LTRHHDRGSVNERRPGLSLKRSGLGLCGALFVDHHHARVPNACTPTYTQPKSGHRDVIRAIGNRDRGVTPQSGTAVVVLVVFVLPGFVALRYAEQTYRPHADGSALERMLSALYFSVLSYLVIGLVAWLLLEVDTKDVSELRDGDKPFGSYVALAAAATGVPVLIAELTRRWNRSRLRQCMLRVGGVSAAHKTPSGWEHFFLQGRWAYVRATLSDGRVVGGFFGPESFAGYTAETPDLYLEQRYQLDEQTSWFAGPAPGTLGVYIRADELVSVEFYEAGAPPLRLRWWRRAWRGIRGNRNEPGAERADLHLAADPREWRQLPSGPAPAAADRSIAPTERSSDISGPEPR